MRDHGFESQLRHNFSPPVSFIYVCMYVVMYVALLNDNSPKHIYTLSIICASFADLVFFRVFRSVYNSVYYIYIVATG